MISACCLGQVLGMLAQALLLYKEQIFGKSFTPPWVSSIPQVMTLAYSDQRLLLTLA